MATTGGSGNPYHAYIRLHELTPNWECESDCVGEVVYRCGFTAVELSLGLLDALVDDHREHVAIADRTTALIDSIVTQVDLVARGLQLDPGGLASSPTVAHPAAYTWLHESFERLGEPCRTRLHAGVQRVLTQLPDVCGLSGSADRALPYDDWIRPRDLWQRASADPFCFEDMPFRAVHQTMECWFRLLLGVLRWCEDRVRQQDWAAAAEATSYAAETLYYLATHVRLLDHMDLSNYHPLRVALKSASGAQSVAAAAMFGEVRRQFAHYEAAREPDRSVAELLERPADHQNEYRYVDALGRLESAFADFLHSHYYRAIRVQSRQGLGSLGAGIDGLLARALRPLFPALDQARFEHLLFNNWMYAPIQGVQLDEPIGPARVDGPTATLDEANRALATTSADRLVKSFENNDFTACAESFDALAGAVWEHRESRPYIARHEIAGYFESVFQSLRIARVRVGASEWTGDRLVRTLSIDVVAVTGRATTLSATWALDFTATAEIGSLVVEWDTSAIARLMLNPTVADGHTS